MWDFHTRAGVQAFADEFGIEQLREYAHGNILPPAGKTLAFAWLEEYDVKQRDEQINRQAEEAAALSRRMADAADAQVIESRRAADSSEVSARAAVDSAAAAKSSARHAMVAWAIAAVSVIISIVALVKQH
jgi:hypothetical protein